MTGGKHILVLVLFAEMSDVTRMFTGWWWVLGDSGDGFKQYLVPSHSLHNLLQEKINL